MPWKQTPLYLLGLAKGGYGFPPEYQGETNGIPFYKVSDMNTIGNEKEMTVANNYLRNESCQKIGAKPFDRKAIVFAKVGAALLLDRKRICCPPFLIDNNMMSFTPYNQNSAYLSFLYYHFLNRKLSQLSREGALPSINASDIGDLVFYIPTENEQGKVAAFLSLIDERINVQNKIISSLHSLKQAISATLFRDADSEVMLEEICHVTKGQQLNASNFDDGGEYLVINGGSEPSGRFTRFNRLGETITISEGGNSCGYVDWQREPFWCGGHCYAIEIIDESILPRYLFHYLKFKQSELMSLRVGTGLPNIQKQSLSEFVVKKLEISDQDRIAKTLDSVEKKIQIEIGLTTLFKRQKEYLLDNLFI